MKTTVADILQQIKKSQQEKSETDIKRYSKIFSTAAEGINDTYYPAPYGFLGWLHENHPLLYQGIKRLEERMATPVQDGLFLGEFEVMVAEWEALHIKGIELYLKAKN